MKKNFLSMAAHKGKVLFLLGCILAAATLAMVPDAGAWEPYNVSGIISNGDITATGSITITGDMDAGGDIEAGGDITATGDVTATALYGELATGSYRFGYSSLLGVIDSWITNMPGIVAEGNGVDEPIIYLVSDDFTGGPFAGLYTLAYGGGSPLIMLQYTQDAGIGAVGLAELKLGGSGGGTGEPSNSAIELRNSANNALFTVSEIGALLANDNITSNGDMSAVNASFTGYASATAYYSGAIQGTSAVLTVTDSSMAATCTISFTAGLYTGTTCP